MHFQKIVFCGVITFNTTVNTRTVSLVFVNSLQEFDWMSALVHILFGSVNRTRESQRHLRSTTNLLYKP